MSQRKIYASIVIWAAFGLMAMATTWTIAAQVYPEWHPAAYMTVAIVAFNAVYWLRAYARKRGWAVTTYAPK